MRYRHVAAALGLLATAGQAGAQSASGQKVTGPVADYWMSASTTSGMGAMMAGMGGGGGRRPSFGAMMGGFGHGMDPNAFSHGLILQLGSQLRPQGGDPQAEHDPPAALGAGPALPLLTPVQQPATHDETPPGPPPQFQQPRGRILIFWGCGEHAGPGQPLVIDLSRIGPEGQGAGQFAGLMRGLAIAPMQPPSPGRDATYGEWPNAQSQTQVPPDGSLQGAHTIHGNYSPDINFTLTADQDFLPPIRLGTNVENPSGSASLGWGQVDGARGYFATMMGAGRGEDGGHDMVMWTSSQVQAPAFGMPDYLSDHEIARLVDGRVLMPADQTSCTIPEEAVQAAGQGIFRLVAYGGETNIDYPPRPPAPRTWNIAWRVKIRYRAETAGMLGMTMPGFGGMGEGGPGPGQGQDQGDDQQQQQPRRPFNPLGGLGGLIP